MAISFFVSFSISLSPPLRQLILLAFPAFLGSRLWVALLQRWRVQFNVPNIIIHQTVTERLTAYVHIFKAECLASAVAVCNGGILWEAMSLKQFDDSITLEYLGVARWGYWQLFRDMISMHHNIIIGSQRIPNVQERPVGLFMSIIIIYNVYAVHYVFVQYIKTTFRVYSHPGVHGSTAGGLQRMLQRILLLFLWHFLLL